MMLDPPKNLEEARKYRYNKWAGNPDGDQYEEGLCAYELFSDLVFHQCLRTNGYGSEGLYCKQHAKIIKPKKAKSFNNSQVDPIVSRYKAINISNGGSWSIYDNIRKCRILNSISPNANYNEDVIKEVVHLLNRYGS